MCGVPPLQYSGIRRRKRGRVRRSRQEGELAQRAPIARHAAHEEIGVLVGQPRHKDPPARENQRHQVGDALAKEHPRDGRPPSFRARYVEEGWGELIDLKIYTQTADSLMDLKSYSIF